MKSSFALSTSPKSHLAAARPSCVASRSTCARPATGCSSCTSAATSASAGAAPPPPSDAPAPAPNGRHSYASPSQTWSDSRCASESRISSSAAAACARADSTKSPPGRETSGAPLPESAAPAAPSLVIALSWTSAALTRALFSWRTFSRHTTRSTTASAGTAASMPSFCDHASFSAFDTTLCSVVWAASARLCSPAWPEALKFTIAAERCGFC